ncbi:MAG: diaminopimelate epimerase [Candidatus Methanolliviera hydrocarbonicum]|uniref:Diaminopimelate epimerase n=1 Tax=Candidatus Methanolliviera hydrocarbonicum TaxID=2491085 RepID=A0A520KUY6_9EURY|nr:MAG: diaminopimelate epimerase [Candidatus Methanolliviera hydrocarbonicum]
MISFSKIHGNGNDFILIDEYDREVIPEEEKKEFSRKVCDRHFGIGGDGVLFLSKSKIPDLKIKMRIFNSDGSEAEMCGNGIRCLVRYVIEARYLDTSPIYVETLVGIKETYFQHEEDGLIIGVKMGVPRFEIMNEEIEGYRLSSVDTGVPHAVIFVEDLNLNIKEVAPKIRYADIFPKGCNVNFAEILGKNRIRMRTYERGVEDETLCCGTGAVAVAAVARRLCKAGDEVEIITKGGKLRISFDGEEACMEGRAFRVFDGFIVDQR